MSKYFGLLRIGGQLVDLTHLEPITVTFESQKVGKALRVAVTFTNHCFSAAYGSMVHPEGDDVVWDGKKMRTFCPVRYELSKGLPDLMRALPERTVILSAHEATWVHTLTIEDPAGPYHVFLTIKRSAPEKRTWQDIDVIVESAYNQTLNPPPTKGSWRPFALVCGETYIGNPRKPRRPHR